MTFAASRAFPLQELVRNQAATFRNQSHHLSMLRPLARTLVPLLSRLAERVVLHYAQHFAQQVLWFRGACDAVQTEPAEQEIDPQDVLRRSLDDMEATLAEVVAGTRTVSDGLNTLNSGRRGRVRDALDRLVLAADELREEVRAFKGTLQAHDANVGALQRARRGNAGSESQTPEQLARALDAALGDQ